MNFPVQKLTRTFVLRDRNILLLTFQQMQVGNVSLISHIWVLPIFMSVKRPFPPFKPRSRNLNEIRKSEILRSLRTFPPSQRGRRRRVIESNFTSCWLPSRFKTSLVFQSSRRCYEDDLKFPSWFVFRYLDGAFCLWNCLNSYMHFCAPTSILRWFLGGTWMAHSNSKFPLSPMCVDTSQKKHIKAWCVFKSSIVHTNKMPSYIHLRHLHEGGWMIAMVFLHQRAATSHQNKCRFSAAHFVGNTVIFHQTSVRKGNVCKWNI